MPSIKDILDLFAKLWDWFAKADFTDPRTPARAFSLLAVTFWVTFAGLLYAHLGSLPPSAVIPIVCIGTGALALSTGTAIFCFATPRSQTNIQSCEKSRLRLTITAVSSANNQAEIRIGCSFSVKNTGTQIVEFPIVATFDTGVPSRRQQRGHLKCMEANTRRQLIERPVLFRSRALNRIHCYSEIVAIPPGQELEIYWDTEPFNTRIPYTDYFATDSDILGMELQFDKGPTKLSCISQPFMAVRDPNAAEDDYVTVQPVGQTFVGKFTRGNGILFVIDN